MEALDCQTFYVSMREQLQTTKTLNSSKTTSARDMLFLKATLSIRVEKVFKASKICLFVCLLEPLQGRYPHQKCENFNTLSQFSH